MNDARIIQLRDRHDYQTAQSVVTRTPLGYVVTVRPPTRSIEQNAALHRLLQAIVKARCKWGGRTWSIDDWRTLMVSAHSKATNRPGEIVPGIEGEFVALRRSTTRMGVAELSSLIEYVQAWCAQNGIDTDGPHAPA
jgi:hypothetical protein